MVWHSNANDANVFGSVWGKNHSFTTKALRTYYKHYRSQNSHKSLKKGISEELVVADLSTSTLTDKLKLLLLNGKYRTNAAAVSKVFRDQKETPLERALWWIEWAMRNPNATHHKNSAMNLNFFEIHSIDVIAFLTVVSAVLAYTMFAILRKFIRLILCRGDNTKRKLE